MEESGCLVVMTGLYETRNLEFPPREYIHMARKEPGELRAEAIARMGQGPYERAVRGRGGLHEARTQARGVGD